MCDIETARIGAGSGDVRDWKLGAYSREGEDEVTYLQTPDDWLTAILQRRNQGYTWFAHNGGEFDYKFLIDAILRFQKTHPDLTWHPVTQGRSARVIGVVIRWRKAKYELRDSFALVSTSLAKFASAFSPDYQKLAFDFSTIEFDAANPNHLTYLDHDVLALKSAILGFMQVIEDHFDVPVAWTIAATAMRAWRHMLPRGWGFWRQRKEVEEFCREGYYGGLVFLTSIAPQVDAAAVDVNSMYPFVMRAHGVPVGSAAWTTTRHKELPGFYRVKVVCPVEVPFTAIPYRDHATGAICWPTGTFETVLTSIDWDLGEELGYQIEIIEGFEFERIEHIFDPFVDRCEKLRTSYERGSAVEAAAKILQNGLYGKFGTRDSGKSYQVSLGEVEEGYTPTINPETGDQIVGLYEREETLDVPYLQVHWAAWITSQARAHLVRLAATIGFDRVHYGDTDSITAAGDAVRASNLPFGTAYGELKLEHEYERFMARAPKLYIGVERDGKRTVKAKGIPRKLALPEHVESYFDKLALGLFEPIDGIDKVTGVKHRERIKTAVEGFDPTTGVFVFDSMNSTLSVITRSRKYYERRYRSLSNIEHSRGWRVVDHATGRVRPVHLTDARALDVADTG